MSDIKEAYKLLSKYGMSIIVPGCFDISSPEEAEFFAFDREAFYDEKPSPCEYPTRQPKAPAKKKNRRGYIYFILNPARRVVKIGFSKNPQQRMASLQTSSPDKLEMIGFIKGTEKGEREWHKKLQEHRLFGEWFNYKTFRVFAPIIKVLEGSEA